MKSHQFSAFAFAALLAALAACGGEKSPNSSAADSTRDIALTPAPTPPAQPQLRFGAGKRVGASGRSRSQVWSDRGRDELRRSHDGQALHQHLQGR